MAKLSLPVLRDNCARRVRAARLARWWNTTHSSSTLLLRINLAVTVNAHLVPHRRFMTMRARSLRRDSTDAEKRLWTALRDRRLEGIRFRRQVVMGRYIADFCAANPKLIIELDGVQHEDQEIYDEARTRYLTAQGYLVLRFWNGDVLTHLGHVLNSIADEIHKLQG